MKLMQKLTNLLTNPSKSKEIHDTKNRFTSQYLQVINRSSEVNERIKQTRAYQIGKALRRAH